MTDMFLRSSLDAEYDTKRYTIRYVTFRYYTIVL